MSAVIPNTQGSTLEMTRRARALLAMMAASAGLAPPQHESFEIGGKQYPRYDERYGQRYNVGAAPPSTVPVPPGGGGSGGRGGCGGGSSSASDFVASGCSAGEGRRVQYENNYSCEVRPRKCNCQVIGGNTLLTNGIASAAFGTVTLDSGDADFFVPYYMFIVALQIGATPTLSTQGGPLPVLLQNSRSGREPNMRRASETDPSFGVNTLVYGQFKDLECVDWRKFASVNNQQLVLTFNNPNEVSVHIFVDLWGIPGVND